MTPAVVIVLALEAPPRLRADFLDEGEWRRLYDWLEAHPELLELIRHANELELAA